MMSEIKIKKKFKPNLHQKFVESLPRVIFLVSPTRGTNSRIILLTSSFLLKLTETARHLWNMKI